MLVGYILAGWKCCFLTCSAQYLPSSTFPGGEHSVNPPPRHLRWGDYKSKLQLYRDRRGQPPPPAIFPPHPLLSSSLPVGFRHFIEQTHLGANAFTWEWFMTSSSFVSPCKGRVAAIRPLLRLQTAFVSVTRTQQSRSDQLNLKNV